METNLADAGRHTPRFHRLPTGQRIFPLHPRIARNTLLRHPRRPAVHRLLKRTLLHTLLVPPAPVLVDQHDPVFRSLVNRLPRTGRQTARVRTVVTDPLQIEEIRFMLRQAAAGHLPGFFFREPCLIDAFHNRPHRRRGVFVNVHEAPLLVRRNVADRRLPDLGAGIKDRHPFEHAVRRMVLAAHPHVPHLAARIDLLDQLRDLHVVELWIAPVRLRFHVVPPHVFLPFGEQPRRLICHRTGLTGQAPVDVEDKGKLPFRMPLLIRIQHLPS